LTVGAHLFRVKRGEGTVRSSGNFDIGSVDFRVVKQRRLYPLPLENSPLNGRGWVY